VFCVGAEESDGGGFDAEVEVGGGEGLEFFKLEGVMVQGQGENDIRNDCIYPVWAEQCHGARGWSGGEGVVVVPVGVVEGGEKPGNRLGVGGMEGLADFGPMLGDLGEGSEAALGVVCGADASACPGSGRENAVF